MALPETGKLVRDLIPEIIMAAGKTPHTCVVSGEDLLVALKLKVMEESEELATATPENVLEEVADVYEVLLTITSQLGVPWSSIVQLAEKKHTDRGGFGEGVWLLETE